MHVYPVIDDRVHLICIICEKTAVCQKNNTCISASTPNIKIISYENTIDPYDKTGHMAYKDIMGIYKICFEKHKIGGILLIDFGCIETFTICGYYGIEQETNSVIGKMRIFTKHLTTTQVIVLSFLLVILIGTFLLQMPIATADKQGAPFLDALFTATTSVCVTGLVVVTSAVHWSLFGHIVILCLIQIGGMGVVTMATMVIMLLGRKISLSSRMLLEDAFNLETLKGLVRFLRKALGGTLLIEGIGAVCYMLVFVPEYGLVKGIWYSVFHSVSAFCNAGIDILGENSLMPYTHNVWVNVITMLLIILGGIGFIVWLDVISVLKKKYRNRSMRGWLRYLTLHSKIVISMTLFLIVSGGLLFFVFEFDNPNTIGEFTLGDKVMAALFQSVTTRTAGFAMISQKALTVPSVITCLFLMFTGGSPVGTAGGVKTSTIAILILTVMSTVKGQEDVTCFNRRISSKIMRKSLAIVWISFLVSIAAIIAMLIFEQGDAVDIIFEVYSALGTAGLSRDYTATVGIAGKIILCICMYLGRIGSISMVIAFTMKTKQPSVRLPKENVTVG